MKRIVLKFGLVSGGILALMVALMIPLSMSGKVSFDHSEIVGYSSMILAFLLVFFGIRSYRESVGGGAITFGRAFKVGILITLVACAMYVVTWEITYFGFIPDFGEKYAAFTIEKLRESGASESEIAAEEKKMAEFREIYKNPFVNVGITFLEVFPIGLIMTFVSAGILRKKPSGGVPGVAAEA